MTIFDGMEKITAQEIHNRIHDLLNERLRVMDKLDAFAELVAEAKELGHDPSEYEANREVAEQDVRDFERDKLPELEMLQKLLDGCTKHDWGFELGDGVLVKEEHMPEYIKGMVTNTMKSCQLICPASLPDNIAIDWDETFKNIIKDYTTIDFGGRWYKIYNPQEEI